MESLAFIYPSFRPCSILESSLILTPASHLVFGQFLLQFRRFSIQTSLEKPRFKLPSSPHSDRPLSSPTRSSSSIKSDLHPSRDSNGRSGTTPLDSGSAARRGLGAPGDATAGLSESAHGTSSTKGTAPRYPGMARGVAVPVATVLLGATSVICKAVT